VFPATPAPPPPVLVVPAVPGEALGGAGAPPPDPPEDDDEGPPPAPPPEKYLPGAGPVVPYDAGTQVTGEPTPPAPPVLGAALVPTAPQNHLHHHQLAVLHFHRYFLEKVLWVEYFQFLQLQMILYHHHQIHQVHPQL